MDSNEVLQSDADIVGQYDKVVQPRLLAALQSIQGLSWAAFSLLHEDGRYSLRIDTSEPSNPKWKEATVSLKAIFLPLTKKDLVVNVTEVRRFAEIRHVAHGEPQPYLKDGKNPFGIYSIGRSIGVEQLSGPGTLGGFITISEEGKSRVYGLTNNHVVNVGRTTNTQCKLQIGRTGVPDRLVYSRFATGSDPNYVETDNTIYCPNYNDLEATKFEAKNDKIQSHKLGQLGAASGRTLAFPQHAQHPCILDWALINLNNPTLRAMQERDSKLRPNFILDREEKDRIAYPYPSSISYDPNIHLVLGMEVYKWGRTTGVRPGEVSLFRKVINMNEVEAWKGPIYNPTGAAAVSELFVPPTDGQPFCKPGDSGSFVVDKEGHLVGLLWGMGNDDAIVTDIRVVFESIREKMKLSAGAVIAVSAKF